MWGHLATVCVTRLAQVGLVKKNSRGYTGPERAEGVGARTALMSPGYPAQKSFLAWCGIIFQNHLVRGRAEAWCSPAVQIDPPSTFGVQATTSANSCS